MSMTKGKVILVLMAALAALPGCRRSEEAFDDRPLEKRPHVETVKPIDKADPFRP